MKTILILAHKDSGQDARLQAALDLCRALRGHLACLDVFSPAGAYGELYGLTTAQRLIDEEANEAQNRAALEARLRGEDVAWDWAHAVGDFDRRMIAASRLCDLIVENSHYEWGVTAGHRQIVGDLILRSQRPVLAVPPERRGFDATGRALIAWDGSLPAIESLRAAVPLLALASEVRLLVTGEVSPDYGVEEAALYLSRHGIVATLVSTPVSESPARAIMGYAEGYGAAYVVMGGYGHSRFGELLFGGVTREMLAHCPVPMFIAH